ncbi:DUF222 domain-containing protein [Microbacterium sp. zg-Y818]|uniref:HNH endonuclease signature motif containing protein n=1 Tax=unclassified Microbacterium TaxID=2609290 RepID=UPI00214BA632|nr:MULTISPECIES: HNH endonuclease signature motif containing protein [unclassified Microbacterium]MCR2800155.1 HNH endonuclease [Microbacterium sp. zg.Y818]WIM22124.1 DUF222 domain-containing protein [Microbacterium sp. zg-Y818]
MTTFLSRLETLREHAAAVVAEGVRDGELGSASHAEIAELLAAAGGIGRWVDAALIEIVGEAQARSEGPRDDRLTTHLGCHDVSELVQRAALVGPQTATRLRRAASAVRPRESLLTGETLDPLLPALRAAVVEGIVGLDGALAIAEPLQAMGSRVGREAVLTADAVLAAEARGEGPDGGPPACPDLLRVQAQVWSVALDQDGAEPRERATMHRRSLRLGSPTAFGVPVRGMLMPEVAAQLERIFDSLLSPRGRVAFDGHATASGDEGAWSDDSIPPLDERTRPQRQHDALATALTVAASSGALPTVGGAAPTLVVTVRAEDLAADRGYAHVDGCGEPVSLAVARHAGCSGVIQRVTLTRKGRVVAIGTEERVFNRHQRRALAARDGGCLIPGCGVPAAWCEIHHVEAHARGGRTHTDNGVLLCWFHHRFLDRHGWLIRMVDGVPQVRAPGWNDASGRWRRVTRSATRLKDAVLRR